MDISELPMNIDHWHRKSDDALSYISDEHNGLTAIVSLIKNEVSFGLTIPLGMPLKTVSVENIEELVAVLFTVAPTVIHNN